MTDEFPIKNGGVPWPCHIARGKGTTPPILYHMVGQKLLGTLKSGVAHVLPYRALSQESAAPSTGLGDLKRSETKMAQRRGMRMGMLGMPHAGVCPKNGQ